MGKRKIAVVNMAFTGLYQISVIALGLVIPRCFLMEYGASLHGLSSTITNLINYVSLLNAGLITAAVQSLYKPLSTNDILEINRLLNAIKKHYNRVAVAYIIVVMVIAFVLPLFISNEIDFLTIFALVQVMGLTNILDSLLGAKYRVLIQADQRYWIISFCGFFTLWIKSGLQMLFIFFHWSIILVQALPAFLSIATYFILKIYIWKNYKYLDKKVAPNMRAFTQRTGALIHQITGVIVNNTDTLLLTVFEKLSTVSIYSVYQLIFTHIYMLMASIFSTSTVASFGHMIASKRLDDLRGVYQKYETVYFLILSIIISTCAVMIIPFVSIYTKDIIGMKYADVKLATLFIIIAILNNARIPCCMLINAAGHYNETQYRAIIEAAINLILSLAFIRKFGIYGVLFGTVLSFLYRTFDIILYAHKYILFFNPIPSIRKVLWMILSVLSTFIIVKLLNFSEIISWNRWIFYSTISFFLASFIASLIWLIVDRKCFIEALQYIVKILLIRKHEK